MNKDEVNQEAAGIVFENDRPVSEESAYRDTSSFEDASSESEMESDIKTFIRPLFQKLSTKNAIYWLIFSSVSLACVGGILFFINTFIEETDRYQTGMSSVERYHKLYGDADETEASTSVLQYLPNGNVGKY